MRATARNGSGVAGSSRSRAELRCYGPDLRKGGTVTTVQLRRYTLVSDEVDAFVSWWKGLIAIREQYSFRVLFAYLDRDAEQFTWAVAHDGDFDTAEAAYYASPERTRLSEGQPQRVLEAHVAKVEVIGL